MKTVQLFLDVIAFIVCMVVSIIQRDFGYLVAALWIFIAFMAHIKEE